MTDAGPITLELARAHLRLDADSGDEQRLRIFIAAAREHAEAFCKRTWPDDEIPATVVAATLLILGDLVENPAADINAAAQRLLWPHRMQVFA